MSARGSVPVSPHPAGRSVARGRGTSAAGTCCSWVFRLVHPRLLDRGRCAPDPAGSGLCCVQGPPPGAQHPDPRACCRSGAGFAGARFPTKRLRQRGTGAVGGLGGFIGTQSEVYQRRVVCQRLEQARRAVARPRSPTLLWPRNCTCRCVFAASASPLPLPPFW